MVACNNIWVLTRTRALTSFQPCLLWTLKWFPEGPIFHIGGQFQGRSFDRRNIKNVPAAIGELDRFSTGATTLLGHNIIAHDLPAARAVAPDAKFLSLPVIDTLFLSALAFPENPYHRLVKDYKLVKSGKSDPVCRCPALPYCVQGSDRGLWPPGNRPSRHFKLLYLCP